MIHASPPQPDRVISHTSNDAHIAARQDLEKDRLCRVDLEILVSEASNVALRLLLEVEDAVSEELVSDSVRIVGYLYRDAAGPHRVGTRP